MAGFIFRRLPAGDAQAFIAMFGCAVVGEFSQ